MDVAIKKVGERDGRERFVLVNAKSREVLTVNDVSERTVRRFFRERGASNELLEKCLVKARQRFEKPTTSADEGADTIEDDDLLFELGLGDDADEIH